MALTESTDLPLLSPAPAFTLPSTDGTHVSLADFKDKRGVAILFICNHCPYVIHIASALKQLADHYQKEGIQFIAISSNDADTYTADSFDKMKQEKAARGYNFPYLYDESQQVAHAYKAACTPDIYLLNAQHQLIYHGQFDDTRPHRISSGNYDSEKSPATGLALKSALDTLLSNQAPLTEQIPCMGCNIKWKPGNEPGGI